MKYKVTNFLRVKYCYGKMKCRSVAVMMTLILTF